MKEFIEFKNKFQKHFADMTKDATHLFQVNLDKDVLWNTYLDSFPPGTNEIYRERREYDCCYCRHFIKTIGNVVVIKNNNVETLWDFDTESTTFQPVVDALSAYVKANVISEVYISKFNKIGTDYNYDENDSGTPVKWDHFYLELPDKFVDKTYKSIADIQGTYRGIRNVFKRSLDEITEESVLTILELISQNSLYKGEEWKSVLNTFLKYKKEYDKLDSGDKKELYAWEKSVVVGAVIGKIRNHSIGTLLVNVSEDMDLDEAVRKYEAITAPSNYKRPKAIYTKKMLEDARNKIEELGYMDSLSRRFATLDDVSINNVLFLNKDAAKRIAGTSSIFDEMEKEVTVNPKKFSKVEEIGIEKFISDVLPNVRELEVLFENSHRNNMVSLIAPQAKDAKSMFKWGNSYSWAYTGNMTDSLVKERVKSAGGKVDGDLRFSIQWNDLDEYSKNDLDAHCIEPNRNEIYFGNQHSSYTKGELDVDIVNPRMNIAAVENIAWADRKTMIPGKYKFFVHQYSNRGGKDGFRAEIEFDGQIYSYDYRKELKQGEKVYVAVIILNEDGTFSIKEKLSSNMSSVEVWNLKTNQFVPVSMVMLSPNYWDEQKGIGNKHYFFMLKDCINPERPNGMFNEYLKNELVTHKRVFECLGSKCHVEDSDDQLSGIGFSSTLRNKLIVKVKGQTERMLKIKF